MTSMLSPKQVRRYQRQARERAEQLEGIAFCDLPASAYPMTVYAEDSTTRKILWQATLEGPGALYIPPLAHLCSPGAMVRCRQVYADGRVDVWPPYAADTHAHHCRYGDGDSHTWACDNADCRLPAEACCPNQEDHR